LNTKASAPDTPTLAGYGMTWQQILTTNFNTLASPVSRLTLFWSMTNNAPADLADLTADFGGVNQSGCGIRALQILGVKTNSWSTNSLAQCVRYGANAETLKTITLSALNASGSNAVVAFMGNDIVTTFTGTNELNWVEDMDSGWATPSSGIYCTYRVRHTDNTVNVTNNSADWAGVAFEIEPACMDAPVNGSCARIRVIKAPIPTSGVDNTTGQLWMASPFRVSYTTTICKAGIWAKETGSPTGDASVAIYTDLLSAPGTLVGTASVSQPAISWAPTVYNWVDSFTGMSADLTAGTTYWCVLKFTANGTAGNLVSWQYGDIAGDTLQELSCQWRKFLLQALCGLAFSFC
jgi:hypothetical protein